MSEQVGKKAILFDVDDTLYDQTVPFMEAYAEYFGEKPEVPAEVIYPVTRKYSDAVYSQAMAGEMTDGRGDDHGRNVYLPDAESV